MSKAFPGDPRGRGETTRRNSWARPQGVEPLFGGFSGQGLKRAASGEGPLLGVL